jgi:hypothetical protein
MNSLLGSRGLRLVGLNKVSKSIRSPFVDFVVQQTEEFAKWRSGLKDLLAGYCLYYTVRERVVVFLLVGGVKSTQAADNSLGRENLYNALKPGAKPRFDTILQVCHALGLNLEPRAIQSQG